MPSFRLGLARRDSHVPRTRLTRHGMRILQDKIWEPNRDQVILPARAEGTGLGIAAGNCYSRHMSQTRRFAAGLGVPPPRARTSTLHLPNLLDEPLRRQTGSLNMQCCGRIE